MKTPQVLLNTITYVLLYRRKSPRHSFLDIYSCSFLFFGMFLILFFFYPFIFNCK
ncbi:hypothetical protein ES319_D11G236900v1 [Gossypium barbadense]|uniref:Uncharacterized protein n=1 Tax=Gossypium barbadense TaxID=3634 RepID=A0A5J5PEW7_GOSBA|nr:hypothetical protein ES319_D11G236900v1 [Gossypium barbadense]